MGLFSDFYNKWGFEPRMFGLGFFVVSGKHRAASNCPIPPAWYHLGAKAGIKMSTKNEIFSFELEWSERKELEELGFLTEVDDFNKLRSA